MRRVLQANDTEKPVGQLRQALLDAGDEVLDEVAATRALLEAVSTQQSDVVIFAAASPWRDALEISRETVLQPRPMAPFLPLRPWRRGLFHERGATLLLRPDGHATNG